MKTTSSERTTARIYAFPVGGRAGLASRFEDAEVAAETGAPALSPYADLSGSGWYHAAAILDADGTRKH